MENEELNIGDEVVITNHGYHVSNHAWNTLPESRYRKGKYLQTGEHHIIQDIDYKPIHGYGRYIILIDNTAYGSLGVKLVKSKFTEALKIIYDD